MKHQIFSLIITLMIPAACWSQEKPIPAEQRKMLEDVANFKVVHTTNELPAQVVTICAGELGLADPGQKWQATDVIEYPKLARRRLIWVAFNGDCYVVHYEQGGYAYGHHIVIAQFKPNEKVAREIWRAATTNKFKGYKEFVESLSEQHFDIKK